jgi:hypothetical protein
MKNYLYYLRLSAAMLLVMQINLGADCQVLLSENFSGFTTGSHSTPSTSDASATLDSKTTSPGWTGSLIYSAGGEIKIGTSTLTGWIETPALDLSANGGNFSVSFDICRWTADATTVQVYFNGTALGNIISPTDAFQNIQITGTGGTNSGKIKLLALTKRFFIDNFSVTSSLPTEDQKVTGSDRMLTIFPVPATDMLSINCKRQFTMIVIFDITGRQIVSLDINPSSFFKIPVSNFNPGLYIMRLHTSAGVEVTRFVKR